MRVTYARGRDRTVSEPDAPFAGVFYQGTRNIVINPTKLFAFRSLNAHRIIKDIRLGEMVESSQVHIARAIRSGANNS